MATLSFKNINKIYDNHVQAVFDFNLEVQDKEFIVFVGPSGCGKSTTLRMIAGLEDITSGQLFIDGILVNNVVPKDRNIAMVFQSYALYPHMTIYNNMAFALKLRKVKMEAYEQNDEIDRLRNENYEIMKQIRKVNRAIKKKNEQQEDLDKRDALYDKIFANENKIKEIRVQKVGINEVEIKEQTDLINLITLEIEQTKSKIKHSQAKLNKLNASLPNAKEKEVEDIKKQIENASHAIKIYEESIIQKQGQLEATEKKLDYYKNNETPLVELRKHNRYEINLEVYTTAKILGLTRYLFRKPGALSGGQRQRVALGRAIVRNPKVFLMDEPLSNLDAKLRVQMRSEISKIHESVGATTIYVTHDQTEAMTMATRIVVMKDGYIQQIGTPKEVYNDPANMFVGGFIGSPAMNFINGSFNGKEFVIPSSKENEKEVKIKLGERDIVLLEKYKGKELVMGVRPETIYLKGDINNANPTNDIKALCDFAEMLGYELVLYTYINGQKLIMKTSIKNDVKTHDKIDFCFNEDSLYFFDKDSTLRIK